MTPNVITVPGILKADGTLELSRPIHLPAGAVEVTVKSAGEPKTDLLIVMQRIRQEQQMETTPRRTKEEIDAAVEQLRDELEEHIVAAEELQRAAWQAREKPPC
jgi:hypothetical protein